MGRWGVVVACALLTACGGSSGGRTGNGLPGVDAGAPGPGDSGVVAPDGGTGDGGTGTDAGLPTPDGGVDGGTGSDGGVASCRPPPAPGACSLKPVLGSPRTFQVALSSGDGSDGGLVYTDFCDAVGRADGAGRLLLVVNRSNEFYPYFGIAHVLLADGGVPAPVEIGPPLRAFPLNSGWAMGVDSESINGHVYGVDLGLFRPPFDSFHDSVGIGLPDALAPSLQGGLAAAGPQAGTPTPCPPESMDEFRIGVRRISPDGVISPVTELGCVFDEHSAFSLGENAHGDLIALLPDAGWHVAPDGGVSTFPSIGPSGFLEPLLDGRFAVKDWDSVGWDATLSVDGAVSPAPCWLAERNDVDHLEILPGGQAYLAYHDAPLRIRPDATVSCDQFLELILADGSSCGFIPIPGTDGGCNRSVVSVGLDGTLTTLDRTTCTASAWPGAFR